MYYIHVPTSCRECKHYVVQTCTNKENNLKKRIGKWLRCIQSCKIEYHTTVRSTTTTHKMTDEIFKSTLRWKAAETSEGLSWVTEAVTSNLKTDELCL